MSHAARSRAVAVATAMALAACGGSGEEGSTSPASDAPPDAAASSAPATDAATPATEPPADASTAGTAADGAAAQPVGPVDPAAAVAFVATVPDDADPALSRNAIVGIDPLSLEIAYSIPVGAAFEPGSSTGGVSINRARRADDATVIVQLTTTVYDTQANTAELYAVDLTAGTATLLGTRPEQDLGPYWSHKWNVVGEQLVVPTRDTHPNGDGLASLALAGFAETTFAASAQPAPSGREIGVIGSRVFAADDISLVELDPSSLAELRIAAVWGMAPSSCSGSYQQTSIVSVGSLALVEGSCDRTPVLGIVNPDAETRETNLAMIPLAEGTSSRFSILPIDDSTVVIAARAPDGSGMTLSLLDLSDRTDLTTLGLGPAVESPGGETCGSQGNLVVCGSTFNGLSSYEVTGTGIEAAATSDDTPAGVSFITPVLPQNA